MTLTFNPRQAMAIAHTHAKNQSVQKIEWNQTVEHDRKHYLPRVHQRAQKSYKAGKEPGRDHVTTQHSSFCNN